MLLHGKKGNDVLIGLVGFVLIFAILIIGLIFSTNMGVKTTCERLSGEYGLSVEYVDSYWHPKCLVLTEEGIKVNYYDFEIAGVVHPLRGGG